LSFKEHLGIDSDVIPGLATGLGGGIGRKGSLCGAFTGSILIIGARVGRKDAQDRDGREKAYSGAYRFWDRFEREFGSMECRALSGCRMDDAEDRQRWLTAGGPEKCRDMVERTAEILFDYLDEV
jgi:C_GCAxxG_C_C family probable redox protein